MKRRPPVEAGHLTKGPLLINMAEDRKQRAGVKGQAGRKFKKKTPPVLLDWSKK